MALQRSAKDVDMVCGSERQKSVMLQFVSGNLRGTLLRGMRGMRGMHAMRLAVAPQPVTFWLELGSFEADSAAPSRVSLQYRRCNISRAA